MPITSAPRAFLVDAYALVYRAYFAFMRSPMKNSKGINTSAFYGFVNQFIDLVLKERPDYIGVAFDVHGPTFRHQLYPDYKANRSAQPEDITIAIPYIHRFVEAMNICSLSLEGYEADDIVGTVSRRLAADGLEVIMVSPDKDYAQLVTDHVSLLRPHSGKPNELLDVSGVCDHLGINRPSQVIDLLGLWGDQSDNIPGCPGVGEKRAKELIAAYDSIDGIYAHIDALKGKMKENFIAAEEQVRLSRQLATIITDVPLSVSTSDLAFQEPNWAALDSLFSELEVRTLPSRLRSALGKSAQTVNSEPTLFDNIPSEDSIVAKKLSSAADTPHHYHCLRTSEELDDLCQKLIAARTFCFDTETTGVNITTDRLIGFSVSYVPHEAYYIPLPDNHDECVALLKHVSPAFADPEVLKVGQNIKFDKTFLARYGVNVLGPQFDTMIAHFLLRPERRHNMDDMAEEILSYTPIHIDELIGNGVKQTTMDKVDIDKVVEYAAEDADITLQLYHALRPLIESKPDIYKIFTDIEMPLVDVLADMELAGVLVDTNALSAYADNLRNRIEECSRKIYDLAGYELNIGSPKQVGELLFEKLHIDPSAKKTKTGGYATGEDVLQKLRPLHPIVGEILTYRGLIKLLGTYAEALPKLVSPTTGRIHTSYNQTVVVTGRLSSSNPNLQNIPVRDEDGRRIRQCFVARPRHKIIAADYSQVELRIMAHMSADHNLLDAFRRGDDIHTATAAKIYGTSDVTPDMRRRAKTANFGIIYGISAFGLSERLDISRREAKELIDGYFESFPAVKEYMDKAIASARSEGLVRTLMGRVRYLPDINSRNAAVRGMAERNAINAPIQGTAADIIKVAMINVHKALRAQNLKAQMILQVHDELVLEVPDNEVTTVCQLLKEQMESACQLSVPLTADVGVGDNWLQAH